MAAAGSLEGPVATKERLDLFSIEESNPRLVGGILRSKGPPFQAAYRRIHSNNQLNKNVFG
jgi:hypothetical protein